MEGNCIKACKHFKYNLGEFIDGKFEESYVTCDKNQESCSKFWEENKRKKRDETDMINLGCYEPTESYKMLSDMNNLTERILKSLLDSEEKEQ